MSFRDRAGETRRSPAQTVSPESSSTERPPFGGVFPGFFETVWRGSEESQKTRDFVAEQKTFHWTCPPKEAVVVETDEKN